jgi:chemotaxis protein methyltransferase CheR
MGDRDCVEFLQWCLPELGYRWPGYRKVRRTVCKRLRRRLRELALPDLAAYRAYLAANPPEWRRLDSFCRIPISRFFRDREVFDLLGRELLPALARQADGRGARVLRCWSAGSASGEEAYSLALAWREAAAESFPAIRMEILGSDADATMLARARTACYGPGSLKDLPAPWVDRAFVRSGELHCLRAEFKQGITWCQQDIRQAWPDAIFDLICCRNLVFTYFDRARQSAILGELDRRLRHGGVLLIGAHEELPEPRSGLHRFGGHLPIFRKVTGPQPKNRSAASDGGMKQTVRRPSSR